jgi:putative heme-binding domain-containing protein
MHKLSGPPARPTAVCGLGVYRDDLLGPWYTGDLFSCEPVNLLVHRLKLTPRDSTFAGRRPPGEEAAEFLASTDPWFRPVQARTGPDGCLWVVDMYRFVIEHPRWIPPEDLAKLDVRAGSTLGRLYRVRPTDRDPRPIPRLDKLDTARLVATLDSPNGWQRDMATQMLQWRDAKVAAPALVKLAAECQRPEARLHALCALDILGKLDIAQVRHALDDVHPGVRRHAVRLAEWFLAADQQLGPVLAAMHEDADPQVRLQLASVLGSWRDPRAGRVLIELARSAPHDANLAAAIMNSLDTETAPAAIAEAFLTRAHPPGNLRSHLLTLAADSADPTLLRQILRLLTELHDGRPVPGTMHDLSHLLYALKSRGRWPDVVDADSRTRVQRVIEYARDATGVKDDARTERSGAITLLGLDPSGYAADVAVLAKLLTMDWPVSTQAHASNVLSRIPGEGATDALLAGWGTVTPVNKPYILRAVLTRPDGPRRLLDAVAANDLPAAQVDAAVRQQLLTHKDAQVRDRAAKLFAAALNPDRQKVLREYHDVVTLTGDAKRGQAVFTKSCAVCHRLNDAGANVGPDLASLGNKSPQYLLQEILDPNRNLDSRYVEYRAATKAGRTFAGLLSGETGASVSLLTQEGRQETIRRAELEALESTGRSLMPEGLEKDLSRQDLADVIAYVRGDAAAPPPISPEATDLAKQLLDDTKPAKDRQALVEKSTGKAADVVTALVDGMPADAKEEYRRIPWVWRVAVAAGKRNDTGELVRLLDASLPQPGAPLRDWQAVVVGGGIINGVSLQGVWPRPRILDVMSADLQLAARWRQALDQAAAMADDPKVPTGTRYDALRMIALDTWDRRGGQLAKYLAKGTHPELQMGAISGLSDLDALPVAAKLLAGMDHYNANNRALALDALLRSEARTTALLDAIEQGRLNPAVLGDTHRKALRALPNAALRARAVKLLPPERP